MADPKFIMTPTGPFLKYRLDILKEVAPSVRDFIIIFTTKFSYPLYEEYHDFFDFVIMDEYRENDSFSMEYELFPEFKTEKEFLENFHDFYGHKTGVFYPWETHRFIFPYLMENNIKNFAIVDTDFIFRDNYQMLSEFFDTVPEGTLYMPSMSVDPHNRQWIWDGVQPKFPEINLKVKENSIDCDGFFRGFHFKTLQDMKLFYDIWCETIQTPVKAKQCHPHMLCWTDWIVPTLMQIFETQKGYNFHNLWDIINMKNFHNAPIGQHYTRVEDTIYVGPRGGWERWNFDYSDTSSIANFIKNNKESIINYYGPFYVTITDTHAFTKLR